MVGHHLTSWSLVVMAMLLVTSLGQCDGRTMLRPESDAKRLYDDKLKFSGYNKLIRPVGNTSDTLTVRIGLRLTQIIDVVSIQMMIGMSVVPRKCNVTLRNTATRKHFSVPGYQRNLRSIKSEN